MKTFVISQFKYCPLVWVFHSRKLNHHISSVTYQDYKSTFLRLLQNDNSAIIHQRNLQVLATEIFKAKNDLSTEIMKDVFGLKSPRISLRSKGNYFVRGNVKTTVFNQLNILAPKIWDLVPDHIKHCGPLTKLKHFIKSWSRSDCPCWLCKAYIAQAGFI